MGFPSASILRVIRDEFQDLVVNLPVDLHNKKKHNTKSSLSSHRPLAARAPKGLHSSFQGSRVKKRSNNLMMKR